MGVNSLPKTVTRQRRGCDLNPGPSAPESSTLTTRLPSKLHNWCIAISHWLHRFQLVTGDALVRPGNELSGTISNISTVVYIQPTAKRKIFLHATLHLGWVHPRVA